MTLFGALVSTEGLQIPREGLGGKSLTGQVQLLALQPRTVPHPGPCVPRVPCTQTCSGRMGSEDPLLTYERSVFGSLVAALIAEEQAEKWAAIVAAPLGTSCVNAHISRV